MQRLLFPIIIEKDTNGYSASCPTFPGCYTQGTSYEEVMRNIEDAIRLLIADYISDGTNLPTKQMVSLAALEIQI